MSKKTAMPVRNFRLEETTWKKLVKLAAPEKASILLRKIVREHVSKDNQN